MKFLSFLALIGLLGTACQKNGAAPQEPEDPDWLKLTVPTNWGPDQAYSVAGSLDNTLLVAASTTIYATSDQGKTWRVARVVHTEVGLLTRNDTIFALVSSGFIQNNLNERVAGNADLFTTDLGKTWAYTQTLPRGYDRYSRVLKPLGRAAAAGRTYRTQENNVSLSADSFRRTATDLTRVATTGQTTLRLPARHYLNDLHLDARNRLYVAASGMYFDESTGQKVENKTTRQRAIVYVSRRPLP